MPIYTYRCENCGVKFERTQKFIDPSLTRCPECNKKTLRKVYTPVGIVFKGSGFYATDNRSPSGAASAKIASSQENKEKQENQAKQEKPAEVKTEAPKPTASDNSAATAKAEKSD